MNNICYTFWRGVKNYNELRTYLNKRHDLPDSEMFKLKETGDEEMIKGQGYIEEETCDDEIYNQIPKTLKEALGIK